MRDLALGVSQLIAAGIPILESLRTLAAARPGRLARTLDQMAAAIAAGAPVSEAMPPGVFRPADVATVQAAESIGDLAEAFAAISEAAGERLALRAQLARSTAYPLLVLYVHAAVAPLPQIATASVGSYTRQAGLRVAVVSAVVAFCVFVLPRLIQQTRVGLWLRRLGWQIGGGVGVYVAHVRAVFCRVLSRHLDAGLGLPRALESAAQATGDERTIARAGGLVARIGETGVIAAALVQAGLVDRQDGILVVAGERSGGLPAALATAAGRYAEQRTRGVRRLSVVLGAVVTFVIFVLVAVSIVQTWKSVAGDSAGVLERIDLESPFRELQQGLPGR